MRALEVILIGAIVIPLATAPAMRQYVRALPRSAKFGFGLLIALLIAGHLARTDHRTFPFVGWTMYGVEKLPRGILYERYSGITVSGTLVPLFPGSAFPSMGQGRIVNPLRPLMRWVSDDDDVRARTVALLAAVARARNREAGVDPVHTVIATRCELSVDEWRRGVPFRCREKLRFDLPDALDSRAAWP